MECQTKYGPDSVYVARYYGNAYTNYNYYYQTDQYSASGCSSGQFVLLTWSEYSALNSRITALETKSGGTATSSTTPTATSSATVSGSITFTANPISATPEQYQAMLAIFGAVLVCLALVWGLRRLLGLFNNSTET